MAGSEQCEGLQNLIVVDIAPKHYPPHHQEIIEALRSIDLETLTDRREADNILRPTINDAGVRAFLLKSLYRDDSGALRWRFDLEQLATDYPLITKPPVIDQPIAQPALFIKGGDSDYLLASDEPMIKQICLNPGLKIIGGAGHWPHAEKPAHFTRICQEFLQAINPKLRICMFHKQHPKRRKRKKRQRSNQEQVHGVHVTTLQAMFQIAAEIRSINPQWPVFIATDTQSAAEDDDDFPVPDDLMW